MKLLAYYNSAMDTYFRVLLFTTVAPLWTNAYRSYTANTGYERLATRPEIQEAGPKDFVHEDRLTLCPD